MSFAPATSAPEVTGVVKRGRLQRWILDTPVDAASGLPVVLTNLSLELRTADDTAVLMPLTPGAEDTALSAIYTTRRGRPAVIYVVSFTAPLALPSEVLAIERWTLNGAPDARRTLVPVIGV